MTVATAIDRLMLLVWNAGRASGTRTQGSSPVCLQTVVLMSDLATALDAQGRFDEAHAYMQRASELAREVDHPELHMVLSNLAAVLMHRGGHRGHGQRDAAGQ